MNHASARDVLQRMRGGFAVVCDHGDAHCRPPEALQLAAWQFMEDHPYGLTDEPYAQALPASFPSYCEGR